MEARVVSRGILWKDFNLLVFEIQVIELLRMIIVAFFLFGPALGFV